MNSLKSRREIKALAKESFKEQYGTGVLLFFLFLLLTVGASAILQIPYTRAFIAALDYIYDGLIAVLIAYSQAAPSGALAMFLGLLSLAVSAITYVLAVNVDGAYVKIYSKDQATATEPFTQLSANFWRKLGGILWMMLFISLWMLLLIIPGIIKAYSYRFTPMILARHPEVKATDALKLSKQMTKGHKWKLFVLDLSFIGWALLSSLTFGILAIVWVLPYFATASAGYFVEIREKSLEDGVVSYEELGMEQPQAADQSEFQPNVPPPPPM